jgi:O-antigen/teichoic acid export membrane protein
MVYVNLTRIVEAASFLIVISNRAHPAQLAAAMLAVSLLGTGWMLFRLRRLNPSLSLGFRLASRHRIRELARPAFAFMAFPAGSALTTQGMTLAVGILLGPTAVALFNPMRTLARTAFQLTDAVKNSVWQELSGAYGRGDWNLARRLHRTACQLSVVMAVAVLFLLALAGPAVFKLWTHGHLPFDRMAFNILLLSVLANSVWNASSSVALSANKHERVSILYLASTTASIGIAALLLPRVGLYGAPLAMLFADFAMSIYVVRHSNRLLSDDWPTFWKSMLDFDLIRSMAQRSKDIGTR